MRILLLTDNHTQTGGAERYFHDLKARLKNQPDTIVYSFGFGPTESHGDDYLILKAAQSNPAKLCWRYLFHPGVYRKLKRYLAQINPDVIHLHNVKQFPVSVLRAIAPYRVVQTMHDFSFICPTGQNLHKNLEPCPTGLSPTCLLQHQVKFNLLTYLALLPTFFYLRRRLKKISQAFIAPSPLLAEYLLHHGFRNVHYVPLFKPASIPNTAQPHPNHFLFAGVLGAHKGVYLLLQEFKIARRKNPELMLYIAGTGPEQKRLERLVKENNLANNIVFLGWQSDLTPYYQQCNALIFPSIGLESFGLVTAEAMSHRRPVIGINRGTTAWLVEDQQTGLLFDPFQEGDLANQILKLADNSELAQQLGEQGKQKIDSLMDDEKTMAKLWEIYLHGSRTTPTPKNG